jgi:hypothetical protein
VILGVRESQPGISLLSEDIHRMALLRPEEAESLLPGIRAWLERLNPELHELLSTPLIICHLGPDVLQREPSQLETRSAVMDLALDAIINANKRKGTINNVIRGWTNSQWKDALMLIAWQYYANSQGQMTLGELCAGVEPRLALWRKHVEVGTRRGSGQTLLQGLELVGMCGTCELLMNRTVFSSTGPDSYRFSHREWLDFLVARYLSTCIVWRQFEDLRAVAFTLTMYQTAGEQLHRALPEGIDQEFVDAVLSRSCAPGCSYIVGNISAVVGNSITRMDGPAITALLRSIAGTEGISKLTLLSTFSYRALRKHPGDESVTALRRELVPVLWDMLLKNHTHALNKSMAWCYLTALGAGVTDNAWPGICGLEGDESHLLPLICEYEDGGIPRLTPQYRTLQAAYLQIQRSILRDEYRPISVVHYLYLLLVAWKNNAQITEAERDLHEILKPGSKYDSTYQGYDTVPHLLDIYRRCQSIYYAK